MTFLPFPPASFSLAISDCCVPVGRSAADCGSRCRARLHAWREGADRRRVNAAPDDLARDVAATVPATFGIQRFSLTQLAARTGARRSRRRGGDAQTPLSAEAVATRAVFDATVTERCATLRPWPPRPDFPGARAHAA